VHALMAAAPALPELPEILETPRLILRCPMPGDGAVVNAALRESWQSIQQWMEWAQGDPPSVEETEELQQRSRFEYVNRTAFHFNAFLKDTGDFIGKPSLFKLDWKVPKGEIGYWTRTCHEGRGLTTEAVAAITTFALETLHLARVEIRCDPRNTRSAAIAERLGYEREALLRNDYRNPQGGLRDTLVYARVQSLPEIGATGSSALRA